MQEQEIPWAADISNFNLWEQMQCISSARSGQLLTEASVLSIKLMIALIIYRPEWIWENIWQNNMRASLTYYAKNVEQKLILRKSF